MFCRLARISCAVSAGFAVVFGGGCVAIPMPGPKRAGTVVYTPASWPEKLEADVYRPKNARPAPAVLLVHGGGLRGGGSRWVMNGIAAKLVKRGYVVMNVTYRSIPAYQYPAAVKDLQQALKWMRTHADEYGIDKKRIATFGYSAGGYLGALVALQGGPGNAPR